MTSNLGAGQAKRGLGFTADEAAVPQAGERMLEAAKRAFLPEFLNRIDEIVTFEPLAETQITLIGQLLVSRIAERLDAEHGITLTVSPELVEQLSREGFDPEFGARPLKRHLRRTLEKELTRAILDGTLADGSHVTARTGLDEPVVLDIAVAAAVAA
jgi:ATP-dependent Clp protease ATP-binding subunit ClpC